MKLNEENVRSARVPATGKIVYWDSELKGFGVSVTANGVRSFVFDYRIDKRKRRYTIGQFGTWSAKAARERAKELGVDVDKGVDPMFEKDSANGAPTMHDLATAFLESRKFRTKRPSTQQSYRRMIWCDILPRIGNLKVRAVTRSDVERIADGMKHIPIQANRALAVLSRLFTFAMDSERNWRGDNPVKGVARNEETRREGYLESEDLAKLQRALNDLADQGAANLFRLLMCTGAREGEAMKAEWAHIDLRNGIWTKPSHHTKQKKTEHVPLSEDALFLLQSLKPFATGPYLFPDPRTGKPRRSIRTAWTRVCRNAGWAEAFKTDADPHHNQYRLRWRIHDLRHTFASHLVIKGQPLHIVGKLIGHTTTTTTARYAHLSKGALQEAANAVHFLKPSNAVN